MMVGEFISFRDSAASGAGAPSISEDHIIQVKALERLLKGSGSETEINTQELNTK